MGDGCRGEERRPHVVNCLRQELNAEVVELTRYALAHSRLAEFDIRLPLTNESRDEFRKWVNTLRLKKQLVM